MQGSGLIKDENITRPSWQYTDSTNSTY